MVDSTNSEVDVVKLLQAYGMVPTDGSELKCRQKVATDEICAIQDLGDDFTSNSMPLIPHGSPVECNTDVQWETCDAILPINSYIADHAIPIEVTKPLDHAIPIEVTKPLDWSFDVYLIEIDDVHTDTPTAT